MNSTSKALCTSSFMTILTGLEVGFKLYPSATVTALFALVLILADIAQKLERR